LEFSVIIPVSHSGHFLRNALRSLRNQNYPHNCFEVLVAANSNDQVAREIVESESAATEFDTHYISCSLSTRSARLNAACSVAGGSILVFADDDCIFLPDWLQKIHDVFKREPDLGVIGGQDELAEKGSTFDLGLDHVLNSFLGSGGLRLRKRIRLGKYYPKLWNMAVPRNVAHEAAFGARDGILHIFNESLVVHEDVDLANRIEQLGKRILFVPELRIKHCRDTTVGSFVRRNFNMARVCRRLGIQQFPHLVLSIWVITLPLLIGFSVVFEPLRNVLSICMGAYVLLLIAAGAKSLVRSKKINLLVIVPTLLVCLHFSRGMGYLLPWRNHERI
jgi:GT2 family glycosyltransferase